MIVHKQMVLFSMGLFMNDVMKKNEIFQTPSYKIILMYGSVTHRQTPKTFDSIYERSLCNKCKFFAITFSMHERTKSWSSYADEKLFIIFLCCCLALDLNKFMLIKWDNLMTMKEYFRITSYFLLLLVVMSLKYTSLKLLLGSADRKIMNLQNHISRF